MPIAIVRGGAINYEIVGDHGPWVALSPGGRLPMDRMRTIAQSLAASGCRVVIHDRRNCGKSDIAFDGSASENELWVADLHSLLAQLSALPVILGGGSSGCRLALGFALRHPEAVRALLLWRPSGGAFAAQHLGQEYYGDFIEAARNGGMAAICNTAFFKERIAANSGNRERLMALDPADFMATMARWRKGFDDSVNLPAIGVTEAQLRSIAAPTVVIPGNDRIHKRAVGRLVQSLIPDSELIEITGDDLDRDFVPPQEWAPERDLVLALQGFITRRCA